MLNHKLRRERNYMLNDGYVDITYEVVNGEKVLRDIPSVLNIDEEIFEESGKKKTRLKDVYDAFESYGVCKDDVNENMELPECDNIKDLEELLKIYKYIKEPIVSKGRKAKEVKDKLLALLANRVDENIRANGKHHMRELREDQLTDDNIISVFDSYFTRTIGAKPDEFCDDFMVIHVYYFDVIKDMIYHGFTFKGEKYVYFTSSAGQIRTKKCVFVKESTWLKYQKTIMCGLTVDDINAKGGNNPNKHLAYLALANSATDVWEEFDIDKTIVIDDFATEVYGEYDLVDETDYKVTRTQGHIPIEHTDGAGMMLPSMGTNRMVRLPWVKGLLGVFDFRRFVEENECSPIIKDIYGKEHDIIAEDIQIIFTKSQFKMWKYYDSWDHYKGMYKKYGCTAGITNVEEKKINDATINYQMLQSLTDITDDEIVKIAKKSYDRLNTICSSAENVKNVFGATKQNKNKTALQKAIILYPELINDIYIRQKLKEIKDSMIKNYKSGKLIVNGKYTFILPDFYAACQHWFMGIENPDGLLNDGEVYCKLFSGAEEVDCLRSPHLFLEHAIRKNVACKKLDIDNKDKLEKWFSTNAVYTSCKDMISKVLQFDVDGDKALVVTDKVIIDVAKRNIEKFDIVPLYYNMRKAEAAPLNSEAICNGLNAAFFGGNIGTYSNNISKIWNSDVFISGSDEEKKRAIEIIKLLCMENNFVIDYAKTLYKPVRPDDREHEITECTKALLPHFFKYAKDKEDEQVEKRNESFVNKLDGKLEKKAGGKCKIHAYPPESQDDAEIKVKVKDVIPNPRITFRLTRDDGWRKRLGKPDYTLMMRDKDVDADGSPVVSKYIEKASVYGQKVSNASIPDIPIEFMSKTQIRKEASYRRIVNNVKDELSQFGNSDEEIADMLVKYLYGIKNSKRKDLLWACYGDIIYDNLKRNLEEEKKKKKRQPVLINKPIEDNRVKTIRCIDCNKWFEIDIFDSATERCDKCYTKYRKKYKALKEKERRERLRGQTL